MNEDPISSLLCRLYELCLLKADDKSGDRVREGHKFEDQTAQQVYFFTREIGLDAHPPRWTLQLPTLSGNYHQFDASFSFSRSIFVVECKNTKQAAKDYLYYFNAKLLDYLHSPARAINFSLKGIFLSTVTVAESAWRYGLAYGIRIIDPDSPPPEYMLREVEKGSFPVLVRNMIKKMNSLCDNPLENNPQGVLDDYRFLCSRWREG